MSRSIVFTIGYADGHMTYQTDAAGRLGAVLPVSWHGGNDFSAPNGGSDTADIAFQLAPSGQAAAFIWRGPAGEFRLRRLEGGAAG
jgi:hypothetical protein